MLVVSPSLSLYSFLTVSVLESFHRSLGYGLECAHHQSLNPVTTFKANRELKLPYLPLIPEPLG